MGQSVVTVRYEETGVAVVEMADREGSNTFTRPLIEGLLRAFETIAGDERIRAVLLHGYDSIFCAGGTKEELVGFIEGEVTLEGPAFFRLLLDCPVPVVAAMQGHAMGGGLVFGLYADVVVLAQESLYGTNFMKYGFTPMAGTTLIVPEKLGIGLASEMLFGARSFHGGELKERGIPFPVVRRAEVIATGLRIATQIAQKPRLALTLLKQQLTSRIVEALPNVLRRELEMNRVSMAQPGVRDRIERNYGV